MKYNRCDFSFYGYYIHDAACGNGNLVLYCTYAERDEYIVSFRDVSKLTGDKLICGSTVKYMVAANEKDSGYNKILYMEHCQYTAFCARSYTNKKRS